MNVIQYKEHKCDSCGEETEWLHNKPKTNLWLCGVCINEDPCMQTCESCLKEVDIDTMETDSDGNWFCSECYEELAPVMQKEYEDMVVRGEIDPDEYHA